jgi:phasin
MEMAPTPFNIPDQLRQAADKSVEQAKKAFEQFMEATQGAVSRAEASANTMRERTTGVNRRLLAFVEENVAASFDFAQNLVRARTAEEIAALQQEFIRRQLVAAKERGKSFGEMIGRSASDAQTLPPSADEKHRDGSSLAPVTSERVVTGAREEASKPGVERIHVKHVRSSTKSKAKAKAKRPTKASATPSKRRASDKASRAKRKLAKRSRST